MIVASVSALVSAAVVIIAIVLDRKECKMMQADELHWTEIIYR